MSQIFIGESGTILPNIETLTGNTGGPVGPNGAGNINVVGANGVTVAGDPGTNTLVVQVDGQFVATVTTNDATPTTLFSTLVSPSTAVYVSGQIIGAISDYSSAVGGLSFAAARREAIGGAQLIGVSNDNNFEDFPVGDPTFNIALSGDNIEVIVTGIAATTINWIGRIQVLTQDT